MCGQCSELLAVMAVDIPIHVVLVADVVLDAPIQSISTIACWGT